MAILGTAEVILKAITSGLKKDVQNGLDEAGKAAEEKADAQGKAYGAHFGDAAEQELKKGLKKGLDDAVDAADKDSDDRGSNLGATIGKAILGGLARSLAGITSVMMPFLMMGGLAGGIGALVGAVGDLAAGAIALTAALGPAIVAIGLVGAGVLGGLVGAVLVGVGVFKQLGDAAVKNSPVVLGFQKNLDGLQATFKSTFQEIAKAKDGPIDALGNLIKDINGKLGPTLQEGMRRIAEGIGATFEQLDKIVREPAFKNDLTQIFDTMGDTTESLGVGLGNLISVFARLIAAASPMIKTFGQWFQDWTEHLKTITDAGSATGKLGDFMGKAQSTASSLFGTLKNLWDILTSVMKAASPLGGVFLNNFNAATKAAADFLKTAEGAKKLKDYFDPDGQVRKNVSAIWDLVKKLGSSLTSLTTNGGIEKIAQGLTAALPGVTKVVNSAVTALGSVGDALATAFSSESGRDGIKQIQQAIEDLGVSLGDLGPAIGPLLGIIGDLGQNLAAVLGPAFKLLAGVLKDIRPDLDSLGKSLGQVLLAAVKAIAPLIPPLVQIIALLAQGLAGPLADALGGISALIKPILEVLAKLLDILQPILPLISSIALAWAGWKILTMVSTWLGGVTTKMAQVGASGGLLNTGMSGAATAIGKVAGVLPVLGVALIGISSIMQSHTKDVDGWTEAIRAGGERARKAGEEMGDPTFWQAVTTAVSHPIDALIHGEDVATISMKEVNEKLHEQWLAMTPLEQATTKVAEWTLTYADRLDTLGAGSQGASVAAERLQHWTEQQALASYDASIKSGDYAAAVQQVVDALWDQIDAELAASNSSLAAEQSAINAGKAAEQLAEARRSGDPIQIRESEINYAEAINRTVASAKKAAEEYANQAKAAGDTRDVTDLVSESLHKQVDALDDLIAKSDGPLRDALIEQRDRLTSLDGFTATSDIEVITNDADQRVQAILEQMKGIDGAVSEAEIKVRTSDAIEALGGVAADLLKLTQPDLTDVQIKLKSDDFESKMQAAFGELNKLSSTSTSVQVNSTVEDVRKQIRDLMFDLLGVDEAHASPEIIAKVDDFMKNVDAVLRALLGLNGVTSMPTVLLNSTGVLDQVNGILTGLKQVNGSKPQAYIDIQSAAAQQNILSIFSTLASLNGTTAQATVEADVKSAHEQLEGILYSIMGVDKAHASPEVKAQVDGALKNLDGFIEQLLEADGVTVSPVVQLTGHEEAVKGVQDVLHGLKEVDGSTSQVMINFNSGNAGPQIESILGGLQQLNGNTPQVTVDAQVKDAQDKLRDMLFQVQGVDEAHASPEVKAQVSDAMKQLDGVIQALLDANGVHATPLVTLDDQATPAAHNLMGDTMPMLDAIVANPEAFLTDGVTPQLQIIDGQLQVVNTTTVTPTAALNPAPFNLTAAGITQSLFGLGGKVATPTVTANPAPFNAVNATTSTALSKLNSTTARPTTELNDSPFSGKNGGVIKALAILSSYVARPTVDLVDHASSVIAQIQSRLNGLNSKTITVTTVNRTVTGASASGGLIDTTGFRLVGEEGRELVFASQGEYVATYAKATKILAAASMQAAGLAASRGTEVAAVPVAAGGATQVTVPITVNPSAGMDELELARATGREFAFQFRKLS
jgi:hypothetical protein